MPRKKATNKQKAYIVDYVKSKCKQVTLMLNQENDADIIEYLNTLPNKSGYLKQLIRDDMKTKMK